MKPGLTEYIKFSDGIQVKFGGLFVASYLSGCTILITSPEKVPQKTGTK